MRRLLVGVACVIGLGLVGMATPATAQVAPPPGATQSGTWVGEVVRHEGHFDYVGSPCPIESDFCALFIARYLIVPTTAQAARALSSVAGGPAVLTGRLVPLTFGQHQGLLLVSRVAPAPAPAP